MQIALLSARAAHCERFMQTMSNLLSRAGCVFMSATVTAGQALWLCFQCRSPLLLGAVTHVVHAGKKSKEEAERAAVEQEALTKITTALEAGMFAMRSPSLLTASTSFASESIWVMCVMMDM